MQNTLFHKKALDLPPMVKSKNIWKLYGNKVKCNSFSANTTLKVIENIAATLKRRALEQNRMCGKFATQQMREQVFIRWISLS